MNYLEIQQNSSEWWDFKVGKVSGTRFGKLISNRDNNLIDELANETMNGYIDFEDFANEDMQFGIDNEPIAGEKTEKFLGVKLIHGGVIQSDFNEKHIASPDFHFKNKRGKITIIEVKCTRHGEKHLNRFRSGFETTYTGQVLNYFACSDDIDEVIHVSYCPFRPERELVLIPYSLADTVKIGTKNMTIKEACEIGRAKLLPLFCEVEKLITDFSF